MRESGSSTGPDKRIMNEDRKAPRYKCQSKNLQFLITYGYFSYMSCKVTERKNKGVKRRK